MCVRVCFAGSPWVVLARGLQNVCQNFAGSPCVVSATGLQNLCYHARFWDQSWFQSRHCVCRERPALVLRFALVLSFRCRLLWSSWALLGGFWSLLGTKMANFGCQNGSQGAFLEALGASWGALGALLARGPKKDRKRTPKMTDLGCLLGAKTEPKSIKNMIQI